MPASPPSQASVPESTSSRPLLILLIIICTVMIVTYAARLDDRDSVQSAIVEQTALNELAHARTAALQKELLSVTSPSHMDEVARASLGLGREGDMIIVPLYPDQLATRAQTAPAPRPAPRYPIWRQWLNLFTPDR